MLVGILRKIPAIFLLYACSDANGQFNGLIAGGKPDQASERPVESEFTVTPAPLDPSQSAVELPINTSGSFLKCIQPEDAAKIICKIPEFTSNSNGPEIDSIDLVLDDGELVPISDFRRSETDRDEIIIEVDAEFLDRVDHLNIRVKMEGSNSETSRLRGDISAENAAEDDEDADDDSDEALTSDHVVNNRWLLDFSQTQSETELKAFETKHWALNRSLHQISSLIAPSGGDRGYLLQLFAKDLRFQTRFNWKDESHYCTSQGKLRKNLFGLKPPALPEPGSFEDSIYSQSFVATANIGLSLLTLKANEVLIEKCGDSDNSGSKVCGIEFGFNTLPKPVQNSEHMQFFALKSGLRWVANKSRPSEPELQVFFAQRVPKKDGSEWKLRFAQKVDATWQSRILNMKITQNLATSDIQFELPDMAIQQSFPLSFSDQVRMKDSDFCRVHATIRSSSRTQARMESVEIGPMP